MLNRDPRELRKTYGVALASADLLRRSGETAKATRLESLARVIARELQRHEPAGDGTGAATGGQRRAPSLRRP